MLDPLAALSQRTSRIRLGQMVGGAPYRDPGLPAKITSNIDVMSGGRLDWGIGAGWYEHEFHGYGYEFPLPKDRSAVLAETVEIVRSMWTEPDTTYNYDEIEKTWTPSILVRETEDEVQAAAGSHVNGEPFERWRAGNLVGTPQQVVTRSATTSSSASPASCRGTTTCRRPRACTSWRSRSSRPSADRAAGARGLRGPPARGPAVAR